MKVVDYMTLIRGLPCSVNGITVYPPLLDDIAFVSYKAYEAYLSVFFLSAVDIGRIIGLEDGLLPPTTTSLQLITRVPELRAALMQSLSFFMRADVLYEEDAGYSIQLEDGIHYLSLDDIRDIRSVILQFCNIQDDAEVAPVKFKNARAKEIYEKIQKKKAEKKKMSAMSKESLSMTLPNLISAVAAFSPTYNLLNIWQLTVYQLYDEFSRLSDKIQLSVFGQRWAAWGTDNFDFSVWYRPLNSNKQ